MSAWDYIKNLSLVNDHIANWLRNVAPEWVVYLVAAVIGLVALMAFIVPSQLLVTWIERKVVGRFQVRYGPNRAGPMGLLQPIADTIKVITKEDFVPARADRPVFRLAPVLMLVPAIMVFAVFPFGPEMVFANLDIGILYILAIGSLSVIAVFMAGWASNNKYSLLGAMRAVAQTVSYELPLVLSIVSVILVAGSLNLVVIVQAQKVPFLLLLPASFVIYFIAAVAELNRSPFDIMEGESEIVAGYHTEYSGMSFSLFYLAEMTNALAVSAIVTTLFLSGWKGPFLPPWIWFIGKLYIVYLILVWLRSTLPRVRVDQLMGFAWKYLFPLALVNIFIVGVEVWLWPDFPPWLIGVNMAALVVLLVLWARVFRLGAVKLPAMEARS